MPIGFGNLIVNSHPGHWKFLEMEEKQEERNWGERCDGRAVWLPLNWGERCDGWAMWLPTPF